MIASILPGRIRARVAPGTPPAVVEALREAVASAAPGGAVDYAPRSGGLLITWDAAPEPDAAVLVAVRRVAGPEAKGPRPVNWPSMRTVKRGMAVSLGVALAALAVRNERTHIWAGGAFSVLLARHLFVYRKRLFK